MSSSDWDRIAASPIGRVYVSEVYWLASAVIATVDSIFESLDAVTAAAEASGLGYVRVDEETDRQLRNVLNDAARIRLLITHRGRPGWQTSYAYALQTARIDWLDGLLDGLKLDEIRSVDVRHRLEHFDERLDALAADLVAAPREVALAIGVTQSTRELLASVAPGPEHSILRGYIVDEQTFVCAGAEAHIGRLRDECIAIRDRLAPLVLEPERGGQVVIVTTRSFDTED